MELSDTILVIMLFLSLGVISASLLKKVPLPYTVLLVLLGIGLQFGSAHWHALEPLQHFKLTSDVILFVFLPTLIFEAGLGLNARQLIKDIAPILMLAIPALLISTFLVAAGTSWLLNIPFGIALIFGALISATDPVAVISLFKELGAPRRLTILVEGESLFNDATAIVVFHIVVGLAVYGGFAMSDVGHATLEFFKVFLGGALVGVVIGTLASLLVTRMGISGGRLLILSLASAYLSFIIAEHGLHLSGVMAVAFCAVISGVLIVPHLSHSDEHTLHHTWEFLADICNTLLFILIGLSVNVSNMFSLLGEMIIVIVLVQAARASMIYSMVPMTTRLFSLPVITRSEQHIMWWGGLKGGLAVAMVLSLPDTILFKQLLIDLTAGVVMFTLLVNAPSIRTLIGWVGMADLTDLEKHELGRSLQASSQRIRSSLKELSEADIVSDKAGSELVETLELQLDELKPVMTDTQQAHFLQLNVLAWEIQELQRLFRTGLIQSITFIDLLNQKRNSYDAYVRSSNSEDEQQAEGQERALRKFESWMVQTFREKDWAVPLLVKFLNLRLDEYLKRQFANILIYRAILKRLNQSTSIAGQFKETLIDQYQLLLGEQGNKLEEIKQEFPQFYKSAEVAFSTQAALLAARHEVEASQEQGELSIKPFVVVDEKISDMISEAEAVSRHRQVSEHKELIRQVSLFRQLPEVALDKIAKGSNVVAFLKNDIIIGEGDVGNALYIILDGDARVHDISDNRLLGHLHKGDFFGEMALLGGDVRTANVEAETACLLLRITQKLVMDVAASHPEILEALEEARRQRSK